MIGKPVCFLVLTGCTVALAQTKAVFIKDGQIYKAEYPEYDSTRLTNDAVAKRGPRWSPDGNKIVFLDDEWTKTSIGTLVVITSGGSVVGRYPVATVQPDRTPISGMRAVDNIGWLDQMHIYAVGSVNPYIVEFRAIDINTRKLTGFGGSGFSTCTTGGTGGGTVAFWSAVFPPEKVMTLRMSSATTDLFEFPDTDKLPTLNIPLAWDGDCGAIAFVDPRPPLHLVVIGIHHRRAVVLLPENMKETPAVFGTKNGFIIGINGRLLFNRITGTLGSTPDSVLQEIVRNRALREETETKLGGAEWDWWTAY